MKPRIKMKPFFWSPIHRRKIPGTIWEEITKLENEITSKHLNTLFHTQEMKNNKYNTLLIYGYIRLWKRLLSINTLEIPDAVIETIIQFSTIYLEIEPKSLEELFHAKKHIKKPIKKPRKTKSKPTSALIQIIDAKRTYNVQIGLATLKISAQYIKKAILEMDETILNFDTLTKLIKIVPTNEEIQMIQTINCNINNLAPCEKFFAQFIGIQNVQKRLLTWLFTMQFEEKYCNIEKKIHLISKMENVIRNSNGLKQTLACLLAIGNFINGGTKKGKCNGFNLTVLGKIKIYKTTDGKMNMFEYLYRFMKDNYCDSLGWINEMDGLSDIVIIDVEDVESKREVLVKKLNVVKNVLMVFENESGNIDDRFGDVIREFYDTSVVRVKMLGELMKGMMVCVENLVIYFGGKFDGDDVLGFFGVLNELRNGFIDVGNKMVALEKKKKDEAMMERDNIMVLLQKKIMDD